MPVLPAYFLVITQELLNDDIFVSFRKSYVLFLVLCSLVQYALIHYPVKYFLNNLVVVVLDFDFSLVNNKYCKAEYYSVDSKLLDLFGKEEISNGRFTKILFLFNISEINGPFAYKILLLRKKPVFVDSPVTTDAVDNSLSTGDIRKRIMSADYVIDTTSFRWHNDFRRQKLSTELEKSFVACRENFTVIGKIAFLNASIDIYKRIRQ